MEEWRSDKNAYTYYRISSYKALPRIIPLGLIWGNTVCQKLSWFSSKKIWFSVNNFFDNFIFWITQFLSPPHSSNSKFFKISFKPDRFLSKINTNFIRLKLISQLKVSYYRKDFSKVSFAPKNKQKYFWISALAYKRSSQKSSVRESKWNPLIIGTKGPYFRLFFGANENFKKFFWN